MHSLCFMSKALMEISHFCVIADILYYVHVFKFLTQSSSPNHFEIIYDNTFGQSLSLVNINLSEAVTVI